LFYVFGLLLTAHVLEILVSREHEKSSVIAIPGRHRKCIY